jgi:hypothetical protein
MALGARDDSTISPALAAYRLALDHFMENAMRAILIAAFFLATWPCLAPAQTVPPPEQQQGRSCLFGNVPT